MMEENDQDPLWDDAVKLVSAEGKASVSFLQRRLRIGYTRAARLVDLLEAKGVIGPATGNSSTRDVFKPADSARAANDGGDATKA
jgi:S-DNA-T family DNA segregation ATPase FtsK/SpoIIIE